VLPDIEALGASLVVISPQLEKYSKQVAKKNSLTYSVLCDKGNKAASRFGLTFNLPDDLKGIYSNFGIDLERFNGDDSWTLPLPARFILNRQGNIINKQVNPDYTVRPEPKEILDILKTL